MKYAVICTISLLFYASCGNLFYHDVEPAEPAPGVISTEPVDGTEGFYQNHSLNVYFNCALNNELVTGESFIVEKVLESSGSVSYQPVAGTVSAYYNFGKTEASFSLPEGVYFSPYASYRVTLKSSIKGRTGKKMDHDYIWGFKTGSNIDLDPPRVIEITPEYLVNVENYVRGFDIQIYFDEMLNGSFIRDASFIFRDLNSGPPYIEYRFNNIYEDTVIINDSFIGCIDHLHLLVLHVDRDLAPPGMYEFELNTPTPITDRAQNEFTGTITGEITHLKSYRTPCLIPGFEGLGCCY